MASNNDDNNNDKDKRFVKPRDSGSIATFANVAETAVSAQAGISPFPIATNLVLSASGLTGVRTKTFSDDTAKVPSISSTDTLTNKTIDAGLNTLTQIHQSPLVARYGEAQPIQSAGTTGATTLLYTGALQQHAYYSTNITFATAYDTAEGLIATQAVTNVSGQGTGILAPSGVTGICRTIFGGRLRTRFKVSTLSSNFYFGLTSNATMPLTVTPLATTDSGLFIGWRNTDTNIQIFNNDGSSVIEVVTQVAGPIAIDTNWHTLEINWPAGGASINAIVDGTVTNIATRIPATTTPLFFNQVGATSTTTALTQSIHGTQVEFQK